MSSTLAIDDKVAKIPKPRKRACPAMLPIYGGDFAAACHFWKGHKGMHSSCYPDIVGRPVNVDWHDTYQDIAIKFLIPYAEDLETRIGQA